MSSNMYSGRERRKYIPCPSCGQDETNHIPVWELPDTYKSGRQPDYMGCVECHTMLPYSEWTLGNSRNVDSNRSQYDSND